MNSWQYRYDTGWIACDDWTDRHLGTTAGGDVQHNLNAPLSDLLVQVFYSTDGTDANSWVLGQFSYSDRSFSVREIDSNSIRVNTGDSGISYIADDGSTTIVTATSAYYKVKVWYLG